MNQRRLLDVVAVIVLVRLRAAKHRRSNVIDLFPPPQHALRYAESRYDASGTCGCPCRLAVPNGVGPNVGDPTMSAPNIRDIGCAPIRGAEAHDQIVVMLHVDERWS
jgi:hypothetical protein